MAYFPQQVLQQVPNTVANNYACRSGPIQTSSTGEGLVIDVGQHFPLVGITRTECGPADQGSQPLAPQVSQGV